MSVKLKTLKINEKNPRQITPRMMKKLKESIKSFDKMLEIRPIVVDDKNVVLAGNMRLQAMIELGMIEIPDEWVKKVEDLTEEQKKEFIIKDNLPYGDWDMDMLADTEEWDSEELEEWGLDVPDSQLKEVQQIDDKYNDDNCEYPLIPYFDEKYNAIVIICKTETEFARMRTKFNLTQSRKSYKSTYIGQTKLVDSEEIE